MKTTTDVQTLLCRLEGNRDSESATDTFNHCGFGTNWIGQVLIDQGFLLKEKNGRLKRTEKPLIDFLNRDMLHLILRTYNDNMRTYQSSRSKASQIKEKAKAEEKVSSEKPRIHFSNLNERMDKFEKIITENNKMLRALCRELSVKVEDVI